MYDRVISCFRSAGTIPGVGGRPLRAEAVATKRERARLRSGACRKLRLRWMKGAVKVVRRGLAEEMKRVPLVRAVGDGSIAAASDGRGDERRDEATMLVRRKES